MPPSLDSPNYYLEPCARLLLGLEYPAHFTEWGELAGKHKRLLLLASRDHGKSTLLDIILPITRILKNKGYKILIVSYSDAQVLKLTGAIKALFESKPKLKEFSPKSEEDWSKSRMVFKDGSLIEALAFGSTGRGGHYDLVLVDDPVKDFGGMNPEEQSQFFTRTITPMVNPGGQLIVTGTYVYDGDLIDRIKKNKEYHTAEYPAINAAGEPLWPNRWSLEHLAARQRELEGSDDPFAFDKEYLLKKIDAKAQFFKRSMFKFYDPDKIPERLSRMGSVDPAITTDGDDTALVACGTAEDKKTYLLGFDRLRTDDIHAIVERVFEMVKKWSLPYIQFETIGFQKLFKFHLYEGMREKNQYFGIEEIKTHRKSKQARIMALQPRIASGSLLFHPTAHEEIISQFLAFPRGQRDDLIDALSFQVGKWDKPDAYTVPPPGGSFEWWRQQVPEKASDWKTAMGMT
jgi:predicted phage terminase large subunit-like protein